MSLDALFWRTRFGTIPVLHLISLGFSAEILILLAGRRRRLLWLSSLAFFLNNAVAVTALWSANTALAMTRSWAPFQAEKLGLLAVAILAPPSMVAGIGSIATLAASPIAQFYLFDRETRERFPSEPWAISIYAVFALLLYLYRLRARALAHKMQDALLTAASLEKLSRVLLAFRDFSNTPLQVLRLTAEVMVVRCPQAGRLVDRMTRALDRLEELNSIVSRYEEQVAPRHLAAFDPAELLKEPLENGHDRETTPHYH
jgi:hypothetical protein